MSGKYQAYPNYIPSGIDSTPEMPSYWVAGKVKYITESLDKVRIPLSAEERGERKGEYPYYGASGIIDYVDDYIFDEETILFGEDGANLIARSSPLAFLAKGKYWVNNHAHILKTKDGVNDYWVMCLENIDVTPVVSGSAQPKLTSEALGDLQIVYPQAIPEREKIANFLDHETTKIDTLIEKQKQLIKLLKEKRQAVISYAVTKGLNPNASMHESGVEWLGDVPEHWEVKRLKYLCDIQTGSRDTVNAIDDGKYPFFVRSQTVERINSMAFDCEAVLTAGDGVGVGKVYHYIDGAFDFHQRVYMLNNFRHITGKFIFNYLEQNFYKIAMAGQAKSTVDSLRLPLFLNFEVTIPPSKEIEEILNNVNRLKLDYKNLIKNAEDAIQLMRERRIALISAAVTGKIDVRNWQPLVGSNSR